MSPPKSKRKSATALPTRPRRRPHCNVQTTSSSCRSKLPLRFRGESPWPSRRRADDRLPFGHLFPLRFGLVPGGRSGQSIALLPPVRFRHSPRALASNEIIEHSGKADGYNPQDPHGWRIWKIGLQRDTGRGVESLCRRRVAQDAGCNTNPPFPRRKHCGFRGPAGTPCVGMSWQQNGRWLTISSAMQAVSSLDGSSIERTLQRLNGVETSSCQLTHDSRQFLICHGGPDDFIVLYAGIPPGFHWSPGFVPARLFILGRKNDTDSRVLQVRWKTNPVMFVDVRAHSVLSLPEAITIFKTFLTSRAVHQDFTTIPKPLNGYLT